jgi:hypothetical protein
MTISAAALRAKHVALANGYDTYSKIHPPPGSSSTLRLAKLYGRGLINPGPKLAALNASSMRWATISGDTHDLLCFSALTISDEFPSQPSNFAFANMTDSVDTFCVAQIQERHLNGVLILPIPLDIAREYNLPHLHELDIEELRPLRLLADGTINRVLEDPRAGADANEIEVPENIEERRALDAERELKLSPPEREEARPLFAAVPAIMPIAEGSTLVEGLALACRGELPENTDPLLRAVLDSIAWVMDNNNGLPLWTNTQLFDFQGERILERFLEKGVAQEKFLTAAVGPVFSPVSPGSAAYQDVRAKVDSLHETVFLLWGARNPNLITPAPPAPAPAPVPPAGMPQDFMANFSGMLATAIDASATKQASLPGTKTGQAIRQKHKLVNFLQLLGSKTVLKDEENPALGYTCVPAELNEEAMLLADVSSGEKVPFMQDLYRQHKLLSQSDRHCLWRRSAWKPEWYDSVFINCLLGCRWFLEPLVSASKHSLASQLCLVQFLDVPSSCATFQSRQVAEQQALLEQLALVDSSKQSARSTELYYNGDQFSVDAITRGCRNFEMNVSIFIKNFDECDLCQAIEDFIAKVETGVVGEFVTCYSEVPTAKLTIAHHLLIAAWNVIRPFAQQALSPVLQQLVHSGQELPVGTGMEAKTKVRHVLSKLEVAVADLTLGHFGEPTPSFAKFPALVAQHGAASLPALPAGSRSHGASGPSERGPPAKKPRSGDAASPTEPSGDRKKDESMKKGFLVCSDSATPPTLPFQVVNSQGKKQKLCTNHVYKGRFCIRKVCTHWHCDKASDITDADSLKSVKNFVSKHDKVTFVPGRGPPAGA